MPNEESAVSTEKKSRAQKEPAFEEALARLAVIADTLENGSPSLTDALALYEESAALIKKCSEQLKNAEAKIETLS